MNEPKPRMKQVMGRIPVELAREMRHALIEKNLQFNAWLRTQIEQFVKRERQHRTAREPHWLAHLTVAPAAADAEAHSPDPEPRRQAHA